MSNRLISHCLFTIAFPVPTLKPQVTTPTPILSPTTTTTRMQATMRQRVERTQRQRSAVQRSAATAKVTSIGARPKGNTLWVGGAVMWLPLPLSFLPGWLAGCLAACVAYVRLTSCSFLLRLRVMKRWWAGEAEGECLSLLTKNILARYARTGH